jgi:hypothetical protein
VPADGNDAATAAAAAAPAPAPAAAEVFIVAPSKYCLQSGPKFASAAATASTTAAIRPAHVWGDGLA